MSGKTRENMARYETGGVWGPCHAGSWEFHPKDTDKPLMGLQQGRCLAGFVLGKIALTDVWKLPKKLQVLIGVVLCELSAG